MNRTQNMKGRVLILTALPLEYLAVCEHLKQSRAQTSEHGTVYRNGIFQSPGSDWDVHVAQIGVGNPTAAAAVARGY